MTKGTQSFGKRQTKTHTYCRRCGRITFHRQKKVCGSCGYPAATLRRYDGWGQKTARRRGIGTGRMSHLRDISRRAKNGFRAGSVPKPKTRKNISK